MSKTPRIDRIDRNILENAHMRYAQRALGPVAASGTPDYLSADRWVVTTAGTFSVNNVKRTQDSPNSNYKYCHEFVFRRNASAVTLFFEQRIRAEKVREFASQICSGIFSHKFSLLPTAVKIRIYTPDTEDDFSATTFVEEINVAFDADLDTWHNQVLDSLFTMPAGAVRGLRVEYYWDFASGTDGADQYVRMSQFKINQGELAQIFSLAGYDDDDEFRICQKFYEKSYDKDTDPGSLTNLGSEFEIANAAGNWRQSVRFSEHKVATPNMTMYSPVTGAAGNYSSSGDKAGSFQGIGKGGFEGNESTVSPADAQVNWHWTAEAEL